MRPAWSFSRAVPTIIPTWPEAISTVSPAGAVAAGVMRSWAAVKAERAAALGPRGPAFLALAARTEAEFPDPLHPTLGEAIADVIVRQTVLRGDQALGAVGLGVARHDAHVIHVAAAPKTEQRVEARAARPFLHVDDACVAVVEHPLARALW